MAVCCPGHIGFVMFRGHFVTFLFGVLAQVLYAHGVSAETKQHFRQWWERATTLAREGKKYFGELAWAIVGHQQNQGPVDARVLLPININFEIRSMRGSA